MTTAAWIFMSVVWAVILVMTGYSFYKLVTSKRLDEEDSQFEIPAAGHPHPNQKT